MNTDIDRTAILEKKMEQLERKVAQALHPDAGDGLVGAVVRRFREGLPLATAAAELGVSLPRAEEAIRIHLSDKEK